MIPIIVSSYLAIIVQCIYIQLLPLHIVDLYSYWQGPPFLCWIQTAFKCRRGPREIIFGYNPGIFIILFQQYQPFCLLFMLLTPHKSVYHYCQCKAKIWLLLLDIECFPLAKNGVAFTVKELKETAKSKQIP